MFYGQESSAYRWLNVSVLTCHNISAWKPLSTHRIEVYRLVDGASSAGCRLRLQGAFRILTKRSIRKLRGLSI